MITGNYRGNEICKVQYTSISGVFLHYQRCTDDRLILAETTTSASYEMLFSKAVIITCISDRHNLKAETWNCRTAALSVSNWYRIDILII